MGGFGSGRGERVSVVRRLTLAALGRLDVRRLQRAGALDGTEHWTIIRQGRGWRLPTVICQDGTLVLAPWYGDRAVLALDWTACHYGGTRPWLRCPRCARRVAVLYVRYAVFLCRHCARLPYA